MANDTELRNVFTAYVVKALERAKVRYLVKKYEYERKIILFDSFEGDKFAENVDLVPFSFEDFKEQNIIDSIENDSLLISILKLKEKERKVLNLHAVYKMKHTEIADILGVSVSSVEKTYQRVLAKIKDDMRGNKNGKF